MKQPRTSDFDPNAVEQTKHTLHSSMDSFPAIVKPPKNIAAGPQASSPHADSPAVTNKRKIRRRHPFDIYEDQFERLRQLSIQEQAKGGVGSMSEMVREALDTYLAEKKRKQMV